MTDASIQAPEFAYVDKGGKLGISGSVAISRGQSVTPGKLDDRIRRLEGG